MLFSGLGHSSKKLSDDQAVNANLEIGTVVASETGKNSELDTFVLTPEISEDMEIDTFVVGSEEGLAEYKQKSV